MYYPSACQRNAENCKVHLVFHGCVGGKEFLGDQFAWFAGFNSWAEANDIIVVYP